MNRKPYKEKSFEHKLLIWGILIFLSFIIIQFFVTHRLGKTDMDNYETPQVIKDSEYVYDSLFSNCNYVEFWNHPFWNDNHPDITNTNTNLFWHKYRGAFTTANVNLRNRPSVKKSNANMNSNNISKFQKAALLPTQAKAVKGGSDSSSDIIIEDQVSG